MDALKYLESRKENQLLMDGCKLFWHRDKVRDYLNGKRISPVHIDMGIHKSCNIACRYCYGFYQKPAPDFIPEDRLILMATDAKKSGVRSIAVIGDGEPTMNKGLYAFVQHGKNLGLDMSVGTNGLLLDKAKIKILTSSLVWLRFNISGVDKYDYIHNTNNMFPKFEEVITHALNHKNQCTIGLQMVLIPECFDQVIPLTKKALSWGVDYLVIKQFSDPGEVIPSRFDMKKYDEVEKILREAESMSTDKTRIIIKWSAMKDSVNITKKHEWSFSRCIDLPFIFQVSGNGECYPCGYLFGNKKYCYGDLKVHRLTEILQSERYWHVVKEVSETPLEELCAGQCRHCETNKFMHKLKELYEINQNVDDCLITMCGGKENYTKALNNPPAHINFV